MNLIEREKVVYTRVTESDANAQTLQEQKATFQNLIAEKFADEIKIIDETNEEASQ